ncbi:MAG: hypothetical protein RJA44_1504 [Pseudomonadota bacterium]|jgi:hypothetical protein
MFPTDHPTEFSRDTAGTEAEWLARLPGACGAHELALVGPGQAQVRIGAGVLDLVWQVLEPRRIALVRLDRLQVHYRFEAVDAAARSCFMRHFDLYMQRGGG